jgi:hypothetical protein
MLELLEIFFDLRSRNQEKENDNQMLRSQFLNLEIRFGKLLSRMKSDFFEIQLDLDQCESWFRLLIISIFMRPKGPEIQKRTPTQFLKKASKLDDPLIIAEKRKKIRDILDKQDVENGVEFLKKEPLEITNK